MSFAIDLIKHLFAICVIVLHMASQSRYSNDTLSTLQNITNYIDGAVFGFFLISGFLFKMPVVIGEYIKKQSFRILLPFFIFSFIYSILLSILGKSDLHAGLVQTLTLHGSSMQLYFLPYLLFVTASYALVQRVFSFSLTLISTIIVFCIIWSILNPTLSSTGSDIRLIPLYFASFMTGVLYRYFFENFRKFYFAAGLVILTACIGLVDQRFFDLAGVIFILTIAILISGYFPQHRLPGSGGIYLLHTPILNFAISILLNKFFITQLSNIFWTVVSTYLIALMMTLAFIRFFNRYRWIVLE